LRGENDKAFSPVFFSPFWLNKLDKLSKNSTEDIFHFGIPATLKKGNDGKVWVEGIASTDDRSIRMHSFLIIFLLRDISIQTT
jgi:hypothetical protein